MKRDAAEMAVLSKLLDEVLDLEVDERPAVVDRRHLGVGLQRLAPDAMKRADDAHRDAGGLIEGLSQGDRPLPDPETLGRSRLGDGKSAGFDLQQREHLDFVVGDLSGPHAVAAIGQLMAQRGERLSAFYVSNVENYLFRDGAYARYVENLKRLPHSDRSVIIRAIFGGYSLPESAPGYYSTSTVQNLNELLANCGAGKCRSYYDLLRR